MDDTQINKQSNISFSISEAEIDVLPPANGTNSSLRLPMEYENNGLTTRPHRPGARPPSTGRFVGSDRVLLLMTIVAVVVAFIALLMGGLGLSRRGDIFVNVSSGTTASSPGMHSNSAGLYINLASGGCWFICQLLVLFCYPPPPPPPENS